MTYVDGFVLPVPEGKIDAYRQMAESAGKIWMEHGALQYKECVLEDAKPEMPEDAPETCKITPFGELAGTKDGETVIFAFIVYKSREHRDEVNKKVMADPRMKDACDKNNIPFDPSRMTYGGFKALVDL
ncbi:MAG: DUF1428 domain-containing protein [Nitrosomonas sp.]|nr:DUF1428 domain-containing protein [Nitrosomonas sp.]MCW5608629.1 DUF1428 domain-containing protein [Nitrosomonas sp.]